MLSAAVFFSLLLSVIAQLRKKVVFTMQEVDMKNKTVDFTYLGEMLHVNTIIMLNFLYVGVCVWTIDILALQ